MLREPLSHCHLLPILNAQSQSMSTTNGGVNLAYISEKPATYHNPIFLRCKISSYLTTTAFSKKVLTDIWSNTDSGFKPTLFSFKFIPWNRTEPASQPIELHSEVTRMRHVSEVTRLSNLLI